MIDFLVVALFLSANLPVAVYLVRNTGGLFLSPLISAFFALISSFVHILSGLPISVSWIFLSLLANLPLIFKSSSRDVVRSMFLDIVKSANSRQRVFSVSILAFIAWFTTPPPLAWDARSLWFSAASWLQGPPVYYLDAMVLSDVSGFADYPLAGPGSMAVAWELSGILENLTLGSRLMGLLTVFGFAFGAQMAISARLSQTNRYLTEISFFLFVGTSFFVADGMLNSGYMDTFQAATIVALTGAVISWVGYRESDLRLVLVCAILAVLASNIKQEGMWFVLALILPISIVLLVQRRVLVVIISLSVLLQRLFWELFGDWVSMPSSASTASMLRNAPELFTGTSQAWDGIRTTIDLYVMPQSSALVVLLVLGVAGILFSAEGSNSQRVLLSSSLFVSGLGMLFIVLMTYALGDVRDSLEWWLGTSYSRVTATFQGFAWFMAFSGFIYSLPEIRPARSAIKKTLKNKR